MKRFGFLLEKIVSHDNLVEAVRSFCKTRSNKKRRERYWKQYGSRADYWADVIAKCILSGTYFPKSPRRFVRRDCVQKKNREICAFAPIDNIVQSAIVQILEPILNARLYANSACNIKGKGIAHLERYINRFSKKDRSAEVWSREHGKRFRSSVANVLKFDISKFYANIDHVRLREKLARKIKDEKVLDLVMLFARANGERGLCIGGRISHLLANWYLNDTDNVILCSDASVKYARYMDDCVVWGKSKSRLHGLRERICDVLAIDKLLMKNNWFVAPWDKRAVDFCGFVFSPRSKRLRKKIKLRVLRKLRAWKKFKFLDIASSVASYKGWCERSGTMYVFRAFGYNF